MHPSHFKEIALSCVYKKEIAKNQEKVGEITEISGSSPAENEKEKKQELFLCRKSPLKIKKWRGPSLKNRILSQKCGLGVHIDILA